MLDELSNSKGVLAMTNKMLSYRRETELQGGLVMAQSGRLELADNIYEKNNGHYRSIFNHCDILGRLKLKFHADLLATSPDHLDMSRWSESRQLPRNFLVTSWRHARHARLPRN